MTYKIVYREDFLSQKYDGYFCVYRLKKTFFGLKKEWEYVSLDKKLEQAKNIVERDKRKNCFKPKEELIMIID